MSDQCFTTVADGSNFFSEAVGLLLPMSVIFSVTDDLH